MGSLRRLAPILLLAAGCGGEPQAGRIPPGTLATARGGDNAPVPVFFSDRTETLAAGTVVKVISDAEGDLSQARRKVVVGIQDGPSRGLAAQMFRSDLRPGG